MGVVPDFIGPVFSPTIDRINGLIGSRAMAQDRPCSDGVQRILPDHESGLGALCRTMLIKMEDGGPVFFRQQRNGLNLKKFNIYKFRSMRAECSTEFVQVRAGDDRITRVGRLLRLTSLDELPQLINILLGDMSLVGPRPHAVDHDKLFAALVPGYMDRYRVLPGLTGLAQVRGLRGPTPNQQVMSERIFADLEYVQRNSLIVDLGIIMRTVVVVLRAVNAH